jgi:cell division protein FtsL
VLAWFKKYEYLFICIVFLAVLVCAYGFGYHVRDLSAQRDQQTALANQAKQDNANTQWQLDVALTNAKTESDQAVADATAHQKTVIEYRTITRTLTQYVQTHPDNPACDVDADGLRLWREANAANATAPSDTAGH